MAEAPSSLPLRRPAWRSRKFACVIVCFALPPINWLSLQMPVDHLLAWMFPWAAWGGGEWAIDLVKVWREMRQELGRGADA